MIDNKGSVVALGNFDGLHKGHRQVIADAVRIAEETGLQAVVLLFKEHPCRSLGYTVPPMLMTKAEQKEKISRMGARWVEIDFSLIKDMEGEDFVREILAERLGARALCCGFNYHFGKGGKCGPEELTSFARKEGIEVFVSEALCHKGTPISSSRIRECIISGNMGDANAMLGENFGYESEVMSGDKIGRSLGAPTINQYFDENFVVPLSGVYSSVTYVDGEIYASVTNIGIRPTLDRKELRSETYIIGFEGDLYGRKIRVELRKYIRSEKKFASLEELKKQIIADSRLAKDDNTAMKKHNVKAIFFDFDDTLQSRKGAYRLYCEAFMDKYFPRVEGEKREKMLNEMEELVDGGYKEREEYFPELIALWGWEEHPPLQELYDSFNNDYGKYVDMLPHAMDVLEEIKQRGYLMGVISNGVSVLQNTKLDTAGIRDLFDVIVVSGDFGAYKPDRSIFDEACRQSGYDNADCLFVGDHPINDVQGALSAGMQVVRMNQGDFYNKDIDSNISTIEDLKELLEII